MVSDSTRPDGPSADPARDPRGVARRRPSRGAAAGVEVTGVSLSSQRIRPGDLYAALPGARAHGIDFAAAAVGAGAVAVLTDPAGAERAPASTYPLLVVDRPARGARPRSPRGCTATPRRRCG